MKITIGITDDHQLFLKSLAILINSFYHFHVILRAFSGEDLLQKLESNRIHPDILLIDANMPVLDGVTTVEQVAIKYPPIKLIALGMNEEKTLLEAMLKAGCSAILFKDVLPDALEKALLEVYATGGTMLNNLPTAKSE
jgi:DNA-binding NarL/FixJ family response regulator